MRWMDGMDWEGMGWDKVRDVWMDGSVDEISMRRRYHGCIDDYGVVERKKDERE